MSGGDVSDERENATVGSGRRQPNRSIRRAASSTRRAAGERHAVQVVGALARRREVDRVAVLRQREIAHREIRRLEHRALRARRRDRRRRGTTRSDSKPARRCARTIMILAVRREHRLRVGGRVRRQLLRRAAADRHGPDVVVRRTRLPCRCPSRFETNTTSLPSGVNAIAASSCCAGGESKSPGVRSRGSPPRDRRRRRRGGARSRATRPSADTAAG